MLLIENELEMRFDRSSPSVLWNAFLSDLTFWGELKPEDEQIIMNKEQAHQQQQQQKRQNLYYMSDTSGSSKSSYQHHHKQPVWRQAVDPVTRRTYYYDAISRQTQWEKPREVRMMERQQRQQKRKEDKAFFRQMERNIYSSVKKGQLIPTGNPNQQPTPQLNPNQPLRRHRIRTISGMDEVLVQELSDDIILLPTASLVNSRKSNNLVGRPPLPNQRLPDRDADVSLEMSLEFSPEESRNPSQRQGGQQQHHHPLMREESETLRGEALLMMLDSPDGSNSVGSLNTSLDSIPPQLPEQPTVNNNHHVRRNTGGTIFVQSGTMMNPNIDATIKCVCGVYRAHIQEAVADKNSRSPNSTLHHHDQQHDHEDQRYSVFQDTGNDKVSSNSKDIPALDQIVTFYQDFYSRSKMEHDTIIMSLIYIERLLKETLIRILPSNWRSILFASMVLASKVWDDLSMWNVDFSNVCGRRGSLLKEFSLPRINQLELALLHALNFNVKVPASEYAKYYFLLRNMLLKSGLLKATATTGTHDEEVTTIPVKTKSPLSSPPRARHRGTKSVDDACFLVNAVSNKQHSSVCLEQLVSMAS